MAEDKHYLIYKITNNLNGKIYIGKHITSDVDDGYMGSGSAIQRAIKKYGKENFTKEILYDVEDEELMNFVEEIIVDGAFVARRDTYNMKTGGLGGGNGGMNKGKRHSEETKRRLSENHKGQTPWNKGKHGIYSNETLMKMSKSLTGKHHSEETKKKMSEAHKGKSTWWNKGKPSSVKGKHWKLSDEARKRISEGKKKSMTNETKQKISEARKRYWAAKKGVA